VYSRGFNQNSSVVNNYYHRLTNRAHSSPRKRHLSKHFGVFLLFLILLLVGCNPLPAPQSPTQTPDILPAQTEEALTNEETLEEEAEAFIRIEEIVIGLLLIAAIVSILTGRFRIPYTVGLVLVGLGIALIVQDPLQSTITPELILALLVPPLIFEAAFHLDLRTLRRDIVLILTLAIPGVVITMLMVSGVLNIATPITTQTALIFGALIAATDPVAVIALFRSLGAPRRLQVLLEGESLFNDGTAIVLFGLVLAITGLKPLTLGGYNLTFDTPLGLLSAIPVFIIIAAGGLLVGGVLGIITSKLIEQIDNYLVEITLTTVLAFGSYLMAEEVLHVSGVLAVVAAGLATGNTGPKGMSATTRIVLFNFWEYAAFLANSFIFLLIGLEITLTLFLQNGFVILGAIIAVLLSRAVSIYGLSWVGREIPIRWKHVMYWGGLRGAISLALVLSLPLSTPYLGELKSMAFGVVLFTLLVQGLSMGPLIRGMGLIERNAAREKFESHYARSVSLQAAYNRLYEMKQKNLLTNDSWEILAEHIRTNSESASIAVVSSLRDNPSLRAAELIDAWRETLHTQRTTLTELHRDGIISEETLSNLVSEVDEYLQRPESLWELIPHPSIKKIHVDRLITAIVQIQDAENATQALEAQDVAVTRFPSVGGFLGRTNVTILIGLPIGKEEIVIETLQKSCRKRVEYLASPIEGTPVPLATPIPVTVGGATIFAFDVERYEEF
jgi:monovalent cation:H+ antiporter, CPA1 family